LRANVETPSLEAEVEHVRREVRLGPGFSSNDFERAFQHFVEFYNVPPLRIACPPDVLSRFGTLFERSGEAAHRASGRLAYQGVPLVAAVLPRGTIAFEGEVDEERMGDW
jgi:hypothetical protein